MIDPLYDWLVDSGMLATTESFFSVGPGDGTLELRLAKDFDLQVGYAEPAAALRESLEAAAEAAGLTHRIIERQDGPYAAGLLTRRYDLIISSASWYSIGYDRDTIDQTIAALSPNGVLIIALTSRDDFFVTDRIRRPTAMTAEDFAQWLEREGVEHELHHVARTLPNDLLIESGELTELARNVLSFYTLRHWYAVPTRDRHRLEASLARNHEHGSFTKVQGIVVLYRNRQPLADSV